MRLSPDELSFLLSIVASVAAPANGPMPTCRRIAIGILNQEAIDISDRYASAAREDNPPQQDTDATSAPQSRSHANECSGPAQASSDDATRGKAPHETLADLVNSLHGSIANNSASGGGASSKQVVVTGVPVVILHIA